MAKKMLNKVNHSKNEEGFVLVAALMIMLVLTLLGIATTTNTTIELQIAGNDKVHKKTFYEAEAGAMLGAEVLEQNFSCNTGFSQTDTGVADIGEDINGDGKGDIRVHNRGDYILWNNDDFQNTVPADPAYIPTTIGFPGQADISYPTDRLASGVEVGHIYIGGASKMQLGGALQMAAGYEGKGKSAAQGGVTKFMHIYSEFRGLQNSQSIILFGWRHVVGMEGSCNY